MRVKALFVLCCFVVVSSACGGQAPMGPSKAIPPISNPGGPGGGVPTPQPTPQPGPPASSSLRINPDGAMLSVGKEMVFTASGADGWNYNFMAGPHGVLDWEQFSYNQVRVTLLQKGGVNSGFVSVMGYDGRPVEKTVVVRFQ